MEGESHLNTLIRGKFINSNY